MQSTRYSGMQADIRKGNNFKQMLADFSLQNVTKVSLLNFLLLLYCYNSNHC